MAGRFSPAAQMGGGAESVFSYSDFALTVPFLRAANGRPYGVFSVAALI